MSVGGIVTEVIRLPEKVWVNTKDQGPKECAIYVERVEDTDWFAPGDSLWWQGRWAFWTPQTRERHDVKIPRRGYSGVRRPELAPPSGAPEEGP